MSDYALPPLGVSYDRHWVHVPLHGDLGEWAREATRDYVASHGGDQEKVRTLLTGAGAIARRAAGSALALLLFPVADEGVRAIVRFCPVDISGTDMPGTDASGTSGTSGAGEPGEAAWSSVLGDLAPDRPWEEPAEITELATKAGPCRRVIFRPVTGEGDVREVTEHVAYAWLLPQYGAGIVMATAFRSLAEAGRWRGALDDLAASAELAQRASLRAERR
jgi:hypothetical protein